MAGVKRTGEQPEASVALMLTGSAVNAIRLPNAKVNMQREPSFQVGSLRAYVLSSLQCAFRRFLFK